jgi:hypothetical protein
MSVTERRRVRSLVRTNSLLETHPPRGRLSVSQWRDDATAILPKQGAPPHSMRCKGTVLLLLLTSLVHGFYRKNPRGERCVDELCFLGNLLCWWQAPTMS